MRQHILWFATGLVLLAAAPAFAADGLLAGAWRGNYTLSIDCEPGLRTPASGEIMITFFGPDSGARGMAILTNVPLITHECVAGELETIVLPIGGSAIAGHFFGAFNLGGAVSRLSGDASAERLDLLILGADTGSMSLQRVGSAVGPSSMNGSYRGQWTVEMDVRDRCSNLSLLRMTGDVYATVVQEGEVFTASVFAPESRDLAGSSGTCREAVTGFLTGTLMGRLGGDSYEGFFLQPDGGLVVQGSVDTDTLTAEGNDGEVAFSLTLTRTNDAEVADASGLYVGMYDATDDHREYCTNIVTVSYSGRIVIQIAQMGRIVFAEAVPSGVLHSFSSAPWPSPSCTIGRIPPAPWFIGGVLDGPTLTGTLVAEKEVHSGVVFTLDGETLSADVADGLARWWMRATRTRGAAPAIASFEHLEPVRNSGDETTLAWSIYNADSVTIDHGLGEQPLIGSVKVRPSATTTYTITASGPGGAISGQRTVIVGAIGKRRGVRH